MMATGAAPMAKSADSQVTSSAPASDYSSTNVQVAGVDEDDILKNDGKYIYTVSNGKIVIVEAFPTENARVLSVINSTEERFSGIFINGDRLVAVGSEDYDWEPIVVPLEKQFSTKSTTEKAADLVAKAVVSSKMAIRPDFMPPYYDREDASFIKVYDISDRSAPKLLKTIDSRGDYVAARMIGDKVYAVFSESASYAMPMPLYAVDGQARTMQPSEISYFDYPFDSHSFTTVLGFDLANLQKEESRKVVLMGGSSNVFVSKDNAYITYTRYASYYPLWEAYQSTLRNVPKDLAGKLEAIDASEVSGWRKDALKVQAAQQYLDTLNETQRTEMYSEIYQKEQAIREKSAQQQEATVVHKFSLGDAVAYAGKGEVQGHVLNQFSMDEFDGYFRVATTVGEVWRSATANPSKNNVYVLDSSLKTVGRLEDLAPGEKIYSARFMGNRAYLVTFKKVDPLFVIGLENPADPQLLGKLKIPGYSEYLHPYDETHLIGLGKDAIPAEEGDFAWYQGVKLSLFDVSDVSTPKELATYSIGDRGTDSHALEDHKAFLFSKSRGLLVLPIRLAEVNKEKYPQGVSPQTYGDFTFQGAYVFNVSLDGFALRGKVSHASAEDLAKSGEYYYGSGIDVVRSAYMDDVLYTISDRYVKANDLGTLVEKATVRLPYDAPQPYYD